MSGFTSASQAGNLLQGSLIADQFLVGVREELRLRTEDFAGGGRLLLTDLSLGTPEESSIASEGCAVSADDLMTLTGQRGDESAGPGFGVVGMTAEDDHMEFPAGIVSCMRGDGQTNRREQSSEQPHARCLVGPVWLGLSPDSFSGRVLRTWSSHPDDRGSALRRSSGSRRHRPAGLPRW